MNKLPALYPHQAEALEWLKDKDRVYLQDEAGLGKTRIALEWVRHTKSQTVLIICPASVRNVWVDEIKKWASDLDVSWTLLSYNTVSNNYKVQQLMRSAKTFDMVIADEAQKLKNWAAVCTKNFAKRIAPKAKRILAMSGTPKTKHAGDLHSVYSVMQPGKWGKYAEFCAQYCEQIENKFTYQGWSWGGLKNEAELKQRASDFVIRRYKKDHVKDLPDKLVQYVMMPLDDDQYKIDEHTQAEIDNIVNSGGVLPVAHEVAQQRQALGLYKTNYVVDFVTTLSTTPVVIFAHHRKVVEELVLKLKAETPKVACIVGGMSDKERKTIVDNFQQGLLDYLVVGIQAGGVGLTLTAASHCVFAELSYSYVEMDQAMDRLHRLGQKNCVNVYVIGVENTIDEAALKAAKYKEELFKRAIE